MAGGGTTYTVRVSETEEEGLTQSRALRHGEREADSGEFLLVCACLVVVGEMQRDPPGLKLGGKMDGGPWEPRKRQRSTVICTY